MGECGRNPLAGVRLLPPAGYAVVGALLKCPLPLDFAAFVACGLTVVCHSTFPGPESSHLRWMMGACVLFAALCSNMQLLFCCFVCYLEWIYLLASLTDFAEVEVVVCVYPVYVVWCLL